MVGIIRICVLWGLLLSAGAWPSWLWAQAPDPLSARVEFDIAPQPLTGALNEFAAKTGLQVSYPADLAAGLSSPGLSGTRTPMQALEALLAGTGLGFRFANSETVTLERNAPIPPTPLAQPQSQATPAPARESGPETSAAKNGQKPVKVPEIIVKDVREKDDDTKSYVAEEASTATRTDTPIIQVPQAVEVVTRKVMDDQKAIRLDQALRNVSGVVSPDASRGVFNDRSYCRGFVCGVFKNNMRNLDQQQVLTYRDISNIQRVEVLKGPPSVLYGRSEPSGIVNIITKQPLKESYASLETVFGSYGLYRPMIDVSGPMNESKTLRFRINGAYENAESFRDLVRSHRYFISPVVT
jgi:iron complex outermembrane receptor protein